MKKVAKKTVAMALAAVMLAGLLAVGYAANAGKGYTDVGGTVYAHYIEALSEAGIFTGYPNGTFGPNDTVNRKMAVTVLGRMAGAGVTVSDSYSFTDVSEDYYTGFLGWAVKNGIVADGASFRPNDPVTGAEMDAWLAAYAKYAGIKYTAANTSDKPLTRAELAGLIYFVWVQKPTVEPTNDAMVDVAEGRYIGTKEDGVYRFVGMKYGVAERFQEAKPAPSFAGIHTATTYGGAAPSSQQSQNPGKTDPLVTSYMTPNAYWAENEDCLYLNVWSTQADDVVAGSTVTGKQPVLVFIHGGGLSTGNPNELTYYDGANFARQTGGVFVSIGHRLNILGYSNMTGFNEEYDKDYAANLGEKDLILGLEWVKANIAKFGGDPDNITIIGQSGGGSKVSGLVSSVYAGKAFQKAIYCSGGPSSFTASVTDTAQDTVDKVKEYAESKGLTVEEALTALETMPYDELCTVGLAAPGILLEPGFIDESAYNAAEGTWSKNTVDMPVMISATFAEMAGSMANHNLSALVNNTTDFGIFGDPAIRDEWVKRNNNDYMTEEYLTAQLTAKYGEDTDAVIEAFLKAYPHLNKYDLRNYNGRGDAAALARVNSGSTNTYVGFYAYKFPIYGGTMAWHTGGDLPFIFQNVEYISHMVAGDEAGAQRLANAASQAVYNFMKNGDPSTPDLAWDAFTAEEGAVMVLDGSSTLRTGFFSSELQKLLDAHATGSGFPF